MTDKQLLWAFQSRVAKVVVGASTVRGLGNAGAVDASRGYLRGIDLGMFSQSTKEQFSTNLDKLTCELCNALPCNARHWGLARKVLNIFLRDCLYTTYLDEAFDLRKNEMYLELPLDSITARHLRHAAGRGKLQAWPGVKHLTAQLSAEFQEVATAEANKRGIARVHLDAIWWAASRGNDAV